MLTLYKFLEESLRIFIDFPMSKVLFFSQLLFFKLKTIMQMGYYY